ncbi:hypothetical protein AN948_32755 [Rhodococcus sp. ADH]|nr:hypothetical protein AN948_32755 [Rhodococcus sp. ADH]
MTSGLKFRWHREFLASDLGKTAKLVGVRVWDYASGDGGGAHPGRSVLSEDLGISLSTVDRALRDCRDSGWLKRTNESNSHPSRAWADVYALTFPDRSSSVTTDQDINHSSPMTTVLADRSSNDRDRSSNEPLSVVTDDDPTEPNQQNLLQERALPYVSNAGASAHERETENAAQTKEPPSHSNSADRYSNEQQPKPEPTPMDHLRRTLGALSDDENTYAVDMIEWGHSWYAIRAELVKYRNQRLGRRKHLHPVKDTSQPLNGAEIPTA